MNGGNGSLKVREGELLRDRIIQDNCGLLQLGSYSCSFGHR